ncbi:rhodanese-like domain-containing protein [Rhodophyticola sp. CCM32]|uniref:rhodanese-like domain-containing protein n=1 Tax=Rhodophyticola sp. CCM32 TaxID=2916397 RepID=UPI001AEF4391|nr:rhodanese-like domain-containing protein [Rhodophyticola sp. CCM32]
MALALTRYRLLIDLIILAGGLMAGWSLGGQNLFYSLLRPEITADTVSADEAYHLLAEGSIILIDIRRPDEWAATGSPEGAIQLDMRRDDFVPALTDLVEGRTDAPIALICARGVRSARVSNRLNDAGFTDIMDVPEGMLGSAAGPGWLARDLPVARNG